MVPSTEFSLSRPLSVLITIDDLAVGTLSAPPVLHISDEGDAICFLLICVFHLSSYPECCDWPSHFHSGCLSYLSLRCWSNPSILCSNKHFSFSSSTSPAGDLPPLFSPHCSSLPSLLFLRPSRWSRGRRSVTRCPLGLTHTLSSSHWKLRSIELKFNSVAACLQICKRFLLRLGPKTPLARPGPWSRAFATDSSVASVASGEWLWWCRLEAFFFFGCF